MGSQAGEGSQAGRGEAKSSEEAQTGAGATSRDGGESRTDTSLMGTEETVEVGTSSQLLLLKSLLDSGSMTHTDVINGDINFTWRDCCPGL